MKDARSLYDDFMAICGNSSEPFNPTKANVQRWAWHIRENKANVALLEQSVKWAQNLPADFVQLIERRRVIRWSDFPARTQSIYLSIAQNFPAEAVFACGSRVRGDYVEIDDPGVVRQWRAMAGKADKLVSDFDFYVSLSAVPVDPLPDYCDRLRHGIPEAEKILVPMEPWDFSKLPAHEHARVVQFVRQGAWRELVFIHDKYQLSPYEFCCDIEPLKKWFRWAVRTNVVTDANTDRADTTV